MEVLGIYVCVCVCAMALIMPMIQEFREIIRLGPANWPMNRKT